MPLAYGGLVLWLGLASTSPATGQQPTFIQLQPPATWQLVSRRPLGLPQIARWGGIPAVEREYGVEKAELDTYEQAGIKIQAVVEKAADPSAAFGLLTFYQSRAMRPVPGIELSAADSHMALMSRDSIFLRLLSSPGPTTDESDFRSLLMHLGGPKPTSQTLEVLPPAMPSDGILPGSLKYLLGPQAARRALPSIRTDLLGFDKGAEIESATYQRGGVRLHFLIIAYPTPQLAQARFRILQEELGVNHIPAWRGKQQGAFVFLAESTPDRPALADALINQMQVREIVTWDKLRLPSGTTLQVQLLNLIMGNVLLILLLAVMAVLAGILIVVVRRMLPICFPHSDWAQPGEDRLIQLNLRWIRHEERPSKP